MIKYIFLNAFIVVNVTNKRYFRIKTFKNKKQQSSKLLIYFVQQSNSV